MARRSYLSRIAQPLTAADPVVWSTPRPSIDEARPVAQVPRAAPAPSIASAVSTPPETPRPDINRATRDPFPPTVASIAPRAEASRPASPSRGTPSEPAHATPAPAKPVRASHVDPAAPFDEEIWPDAPSSVSTRRVEIGRVRPIAAEPPTPVAAMRADEKPDADRRLPAPVTERTRPIEIDPFDDDVSPPDHAASPRMSRQGVPAAQASDPAPRLHIGAIEIRMTTPPPPPVATPPAPVVMHASPAASAPLARAYASRFGLAQS